MSPVLQIALGAVAILVQTVAWAALWVRSRPRPPVTDPALLRRLDEIEALLRRPPEPRAGSTKPAPAVRVSVSRKARQVAPTLRVDPPASPGPTLINVPSLFALGSEATAASASAELAGRFGAIWTLAEAGSSAETIARATGQPIGQVELILGLRRSNAVAPIAKGEAHE